MKKNIKVSEEKPQPVLDKLIARERRRAMLEDGMQVQFKHNAKTGMLHLGDFALHITNQLKINDLIIIPMDSNMSEKKAALAESRARIAHLLFGDISLRLASIQEAIAIRALPEAQRQIDNLKELLK